MFDRLRNRPPTVADPANGTRRVSGRFEGRQHSAPLDPVLVPFAQAANEEESQQLLTQLLGDYADPVINEILRRKLRVRVYGDAPQIQDVQDIRSEVHLHLLKRLRRVKTDERATSIANFHGYVAVVTYNAFHQYLRGKHPARSCLKNELQYLLTHAVGFATWKSDRRTQCGLQAMQEKRISAEARERLQHLLDSPASFDPGVLSDERDRRLRELVSRIFEWVDGPIELDQLVTIVAGVTGIRTEIALDDGPAIDPPGPDPSVESKLERQKYLRQFWTEVCALPPRQRIALLLNFDEIQGLPILGIVSIRGIAEALDMPAEELEERWNRLPLEDAVIAQHLGVTRMQVINLRKSARERLARRMNNRACHAI